MAAAVHLEVEVHLGLGREAIIEGEAGVGHGVEGAERHLELEGAAGARVGHGEGVAVVAGFEAGGGAAGRAGPPGRAVLEVVQEGFVRGGDLGRRGQRGDGGGDPRAERVLRAEGVLVGDPGAGDHHRVVVGPQAHAAGVEGLGVGVFEHERVVHEAGDRGPVLFDGDVPPLAVEAVGFGRAVEERGRPQGQLGGGGDDLAAAQEGGGGVVPAAVDEGVAGGGVLAVGAQRDVEVARAVDAAVALDHLEGGEEVHGEVAAEALLVPQHGGVGRAAAHPRPLGRTGPAVLHLPGAAGDAPGDGGRLEVIVEHAFAVDRALFEGGPPAFGPEGGAAAGQGRGVAVPEDQGVVGEGGGAVGDPAQFDGPGAGGSSALPHRLRGAEERELVRAAGLGLDDELVAGLGLLPVGAHDEAQLAGQAGRLAEVAAHGAIAPVLDLVPGEGAGGGGGGELPVAGGGGPGLHRVLAGEDAVVDAHGDRALGARETHGPEARGRPREEAHPPGAGLWPQRREGGGAVEGDAHAAALLCKQDAVGPRAAVPGQRGGGEGGRPAVAHFADLELPGGEDGGGVVALAAPVEEQAGLAVRGVEGGFELEVAPGVALEERAGAAHAAAGGGPVARRVPAVEGRALEALDAQVEAADEHVVEVGARGVGAPEAGQALEERVVGGAEQRVAVNAGREFAVAGLEAEEEPVVGAELALAGVEAVGDAVEAAQQLDDAGARVAAEEVVVGVVLAQDDEAEGLAAEGADGALDAVVAPGGIAGHGKGRGRLGALAEEREGVGAAGGVEALALAQLGDGPLAAGRLPHAGLAGGAHEVVGEVDFAERRLGRAGRIEGALGRVVGAAGQGELVEPQGAGGGEMQLARAARQRHRAQVHPLPGIVRNGGIEPLAVIPCGDGDGLAPDGAGAGPHGVTPGGRCAHLEQGRRAFAHQLEALALRGAAVAVQARRAAQARGQLALHAHERHGAAEQRGRQQQQGRDDVQEAGHQVACSPPLEPSRFLYLIKEGAGVQT